jgi:radical SAM superfamily enzyme YgiQ (UPF0313 family)
MNVYATELAAPMDQLAGWGFQVVISEARRAGHDIRYVPLYGSERGARPDVWLVSLPYAGDAWRLVDFFELAGEDIDATKRSGKTRYVLGGHGVVNPEPFAGSVDAVFLGEADDAIGEILGALPDMNALGDVVGVDTWTRPSVRCRTALAPERRGAHLVRSGKAGVGDTVYLEIARGCRTKCAFCEVGWVHSYWERSRDEALRLAAEAEAEHRVGVVLSAPDTDGVDWFAGAIADGSYDPRWRSTCVRRYLRSAEVTPSGRRGRIRFGVEGVTERLRSLVGKPVTDPELAAALARSQREGYRMARIFLIAGLPSETTRDRRHVAELMRMIVKARFRHWKACDVKVTPLSPQPLTPMGRFGIWRSVRAAREWRTIARAMARREPQWRSVMVDRHSTEADVVKRMGRGDLARYLRARPRGEPSHQRDTERAVSASGLDYRALVLDDIPLDATLPWTRVKHPMAVQIARAESAFWRRAGATA